jgi:predicted RNA-binding protein with PIN domain
MPYLVDGHNLIPKLGLSLRNADDEMELVTRLQTFCRVERQQVEVYFDGAPAGRCGRRKFGLVTAHFVRLGTTADAAIRSRLHSLGRAARGWIVVTSDRQVQTEARACGAQVSSSDAFAKYVDAAMRSPAGSPTVEEPILTDQDVEEWLRLFQKKITK